VSARPPIELSAVGDVMIKRDDPLSIFELALPVLRAADISFGNCESTYATAGVRNPHTRGEIRGDPKSIEALEAAFDVMSFANNHHLDAGEDAFFETLRLLHDAGIETCGAGANLREARQPAVVERSGTRVAFLGYTAILYPGYDATEDRAGAVPLRTTTSYQQVEMEQPGSPPRIITEADPGDSDALRRDVIAAREGADVVVVSLHWGLHFTPASVADYETEVGRAAIDAGADIVIGHHQHILQPIQVYRGKVIFHGVGNFALDVHLAEHADSPGLKEMNARYPHSGVVHRPDYPTYPFHPDARRSLIVRCRIEEGRIVRVSFVPCYINPLGQPEPLTASDPRFAEVAQYVREITTKAGFDVRFQACEQDVEVASASGA
jgi:poly-gamma-glutamate capsule biosynthesis protein CapA/YwtB (metallophosphatase superfamily)